MIIDQDEIEALLAQANGMADETAGGGAATMEAPPMTVSVSPEVARLLRIKVPVIVQLAARRMYISTVRKLSLGMILEFHKPIDEPLDLLISNRPIGRGDAVKVGEHFGLRVTAIRNPAARIKSMGD